MKFDPAEVSAFLGVEGRHDPDNPNRVMFRLFRSSDHLLLTVDVDRSEVSIEIFGADSTTQIFTAMFKCTDIVVSDETPSKIKPHIRMVLAGTTLEVSAFWLYGPPSYDCDFLSIDLNYAQPRSAASPGLPDR